MVRFDVALFDVDTREPSVDGKSLVFRARADPIRGNLERLFACPSGGNRLIVATTCLHAAPIRNVLPDSARFVGMDEADIDWSRELRRRHEFFLEKRSLGSPEANRRRCAFDVVRGNPNVERLVHTADTNLWCVFGVSPEYCVRSAALGLLALGQTVVVLRDAVVPSLGSGPAMKRALAELESRGAKIASTGDFLGAHA